MILLPLTLAMTAAFGPPDGLQVSAHLAASELQVGSSYEIQLKVEFPEAVVASAAGAPAPFLQIDVPASVKLKGKELTTFRELASNEFIQEPYERLLKGPESSIGFEIVSEPKEGESIGLNVLAYVSQADGSEPVFVRRRLELPIALGKLGEEGLQAVEARKKNSNWGTDSELLQIGDKLEGFSLPQADGTQVDVGQWIGKRNIILTTYRAHW